MKQPRRAVLPLFVLALVTTGAGPAAAQPKPVGWTTTANLSGVFTGGNSQASSFGLRARTERNWLRTQFFLDGGGIRQAAVDEVFYAVGTPSDFTVTDLSKTSTKAENYFAATGFERRVTERFFWNLGGGFKRDLFSGVEELWSGSAGIGYFWTNRTSQDLKLGLAATYNRQKETVPDPATKDNYAGLRITADYGVKFGTTKQSSFTSKVVFDENLEVTEDFRSVWDNALTVAVNRRLALQLGGKWAYRNLPALREVDLFAIEPGAGVGAIGKVFVPYQKSDVWLTVSLVLNWGPAGPSGAKPTP
jgi:hypothetical protein